MKHAEEDDGRGKIELDSQHCEHYLQMLAPFHQKVFKGNVPLTTEEVGEINRAYHELIALYTSKSVKERRILGRIDAIMRYDALMKQSARHEELRGELGDLSEELSAGLEDRTLAPEKERRICGRIEEISGILSPEYH